MSATRELPAEQKDSLGLISFLSETAWAGVRRIGAVLLLLALGVTPTLGAFAWALDQHVTVMNLTAVLDTARDTPTQAVSMVIYSTSGLARTLLVLVAAVALSVLVVGAALAHLMARQVAGLPAPWWTSLRASVTRLHRTLPALAVIAALLFLPVALTGWTLLDALGRGVRTWQEPAWTAGLTALTSALLAAWLLVRLAHLLPAGVTLPRRTWTLPRALASTSGHWWRTGTRLAVSALVLSGLTGATVSLLMPNLISGTAEQVRWTLIGVSGMVMTALLLWCAALGSSWGMTRTGKTALAPKQSIGALQNDPKIPEVTGPSASEIGEELQRRHMRTR